MKKPNYLTFGRAVSDLNVYETKCSILSFLIDLHYAESVCLYYGLCVCWQIKSYHIKAFVNVNFSCRVKRTKIEQ